MKISFAAASKHYDPSSHKNALAPSAPSSSSLCSSRGEDNFAKAQIGKVQFVMILEFGPLEVSVVKPKDIKT